MWLQSGCDVVNSILLDIIMNIKQVEVLPIVNTAIEAVQLCSVQCI